MAEENGKHKNNPTSLNDAKPEIRSSDFGFGISDFEFHISKYKCMSFDLTDKR